MGALINPSMLEPVEFDPFAGSPVERVMPTSEAQREVWLADKLGIDASLAFNESVNLRLRGPVDVTALQDAVRSVVQRHESLRSTIGPDGTELIVSADVPIDVPIFDLRNVDAGAQTATLERAAVLCVERPFDVEHGPLFRTALYRLSDVECLLQMTAHHIICDGWSWGVIAEDLGALYVERLGEAPAPDEPACYSSYVAWEIDKDAGPEMLEHEQFWLKQFAGGSLPTLDLPTDRLRPRVRTFKSRRVDHLLDAALVADVRKLGAKAGASVFATLFSGFAATLHRLTGHDDLIVGVPAAGQSASGMTGLVGHCVNLLPIRVAIDPAQAFDSFVAKAGGELLDAFDHQTMTYGTLLKKLPVHRDPSRLPLVSVMFNVDQAVSLDATAFGDLSVELTANARRFENFELFVNAAPVKGGGFSLECQYNTDLFDAETIKRWLEAYETLLRAATRDSAQAISKLNWLSPTQLQAIAALQPAPTSGAQGLLMHTAFVRQCVATPNAIALQCGDVQLSYQQLDQQSNRLAHALRSRGIRRGERVGLCVSRSADMVVSLLAVLKAGATYVPLDPGFPEARLAYYAEDAQLALLITESQIATAPTKWRSDADKRVLVLDTDTAWRKNSADALDAGEFDATGEDAAYIIYTSGSTGKPKGVCLPHRAVANFLVGMAAEPGIRVDDRLAAVTTLSFDIAVLELMLPLTVGARVIVVPRDIAMDGNQLRALLESSGATIMQATPGMWRMVLDTDWHGGEGFKALVGGESCPPDLAYALLDRVGELWNMYGPTETTVWSTVWPVDRSKVEHRGMSIGRPIANTTVWILDENLQPCPIGVPGEICIGGAGVALGYLDRAELTADRFKAGQSGIGAETYYRTGDRGRWRNDGLLEHLGRLDFQVKVRGYRIELGEIEAGCNEVAGIAQSVVMAREDNPGDVRLVAYVTLNAGAAFNEPALRAHLRVRLPEYMLPQHVVVLPTMPFLPNGKIDRKSLPAPEINRPAESTERVAPRNEVESKVLQAMEAVLNLPGFGVHDDFFALGGHSLLAARLIARLNRDFALGLPLRTLFESPTAERLSIVVQRALASTEPRRKSILHDPKRRSAPLTPMQERIRFVEELHPERVVYNTPSAHRLTGKMDVAKFQLALRELVRRQPALRTQIAVGPNGRGHVQIISESVDFAIPYEDLTTIPSEQRHGELMRRMQAIVDTPLNIYQAPLFKTALYKLADDQHAFLFMPHHIIWDGWSFDLLYEEMSGIYSALLEDRAVSLPPLSVTYGDFAQWQSEWLLGAEFQSQLRYWKDRFAKAPIGRAPQTDYPRRTGMTGTGAAEWVRLDAPLTERLRGIARAAGATLNMLTMATYAAMMASIIETESIVVGMPVRGRAQAELEPVMGFFNNILPVPLAIPSTGTVVDFLLFLKGEMVEVFGNQEIPFERLAVEPEVASRSQKAGIYQALFSFQDARDRSRQWGGLSQQSILIFQKGATEDLGLWLMEVPNGLEGGFTYNADVYSSETATAFRERYIEMLRRMAANPSLTLAELMSKVNSPSAAYLKKLAAVDDEAERIATQESTARRVLAEPLTSESEKTVASIWASLLHIDAAQIGCNDRFFALGGNSLLAMQLGAQTEKHFSRKLMLNDLVTDPTVKELAAMMGKPIVRDSLALIRPGEGRPPVFLVHDGEGETLLYRNLAKRLDAGHAVYGLQPHAAQGYALLHTRLSDMARHHIEKIRRVQPHGPYFLGGLCAGGVIAYEMAKQLEQEGESVAMLGLLDAADIGVEKRAGRVAYMRFARFASAFRGDASASGVLALPTSILKASKKLKSLLMFEVSSRFTAAVSAIKVRLLRHYIDKNATPPDFLRSLTVADILQFAIEHDPSGELLKGNAVLFRATTVDVTPDDEPYIERYSDPLFGWRRRIKGAIECFDVSGGHYSMLQEDHADSLARHMQAYIDKSIAHVESPAESLGVVEGPSAVPTRRPTVLA